jgi:hypothetical protein
MAHLPPTKRHSNYSVRLKTNFYFIIYLQIDRKETALVVESGRIFEKNANCFF